LELIQDTGLFAPYRYIDLDAIL